MTVQCNKLTCSQQVVAAIDAGVVVEGPTSRRDQANIGCRTKDAGEGDLPAQLEGCAGQACRIGGSCAQGSQSLSLSAVAGLVCYKTQNLWSEHSSAWSHTTSCIWCLFKLSDRHLQLVQQKQLFVQ